MDHAVALAGVARALLERGAHDTLIGGDAAELALRHRSSAATASTRIDAYTAVARFSDSRKMMAARLRGHHFLLRATRERVEITDC